MAIGLQTSQSRQSFTAKVNLRPPRQDITAAELAYWHLLKWFIYFYNTHPPAEMAEPEINAFLTRLALKENGSASTQNQALSALLFFYRHVIRRKVGDLSEVIRARKSKRVLVVMTRNEVQVVPSNVTGDKLAMASLMY